MGFELRVWSLELRVSGLGFRVQGLESRVEGSTSWVLVSGFRFPGSGLTAYSLV